MKNKKEEILLATIELSAEYGLKSLSMSQIAQRVGIKKPSLYNHFKSKEDLIKEMYGFIREKSKQNIAFDNFESIKSKSAKDILNQSVLNYKKMVTNKDLYNFYKVIYSERTTNLDAAKILIEETNKMVEATKILFKVLKENNKLSIDNVDIEATSFAMTIHSLIDYEMDCNIAKVKYDKNMLQNYIEYFCKKYSKE